MIYDNDNNEPFSRQRFVLKPWLRPGALAAATLLLSASLTVLPDAKPTATATLSPDYKPILSFFQEFGIYSTPSPFSTPFKESRPSSLLPVCVVGDPRSPSSSSPKPLQAIFPQEELIGSPQLAQEVENLFSANQKSVRTMDAELSQGATPQRNKEIRLPIRDHDADSLKIDLAGLGYIQTRSQIIDARPDSMMNLYLQPGALSKEKNFAGIYAPFRNCANGIEMAMALSDNNLLIAMFYDQPHSRINNHPTRRSNFIRLSNFDPNKTSGNIISAQTVSGIYVGSVTINGKHLALEPILRT